jgi:formate dehydrogenase subunit gamma
VSASQVIPGSREGRIVRYTLDERIHHWMASLSYVYCLITGLAFWSPYLYWLAALAGGGATARFWHPWSGVLFTISIVWMFKLWRGDMAITDTDRAWSKDVKYYIENEDEKLPPVGRFNWGQKVFFWLMLWGAILLLLSGFGLWFVESIPAWLRSARNHRRVHHSRLHGNRDGPRRLRRDRYRGSDCGVGSPSSQALVRTGH